MNKILFSLSFLTIGIFSSFSSRLQEKIEKKIKLDLILCLKKEITYRHKVLGDLQTMLNLERDMENLHKLLGKLEKTKIKLNSKKDIVFNDKYSTGKTLKETENFFIESTFLKNDDIESLEQAIAVLEKKIPLFNEIRQRLMEKNIYKSKAWMMKTIEDTVTQTTELFFILEDLSQDIKKYPKN